MQSQMGQKIGERFHNLGSFLGAGVECGDDVFIGMNSVVGDRSVIGSRTKVWHFVNMIGYNRVGADCMIGSYVQLDPRAEVGDRTRIQPYTVVSTDWKVGQGCFVSTHVLFTNAKYPPTEKLEPGRVGDSVIIGGHVVVLPGIKIGDGAVIDSGSVVTKDVPEFEEWRGSPARFLRSREKYDAAKALWEAEGY